MTNVIGSGQSDQTIRLFQAPRKVGFTFHFLDDWTELSVTECVGTAQERTAWRAKVSLALAFDPQE